MKQIPLTKDCAPRSHLGPLLSLETVVANEFLDWKPAWLAGGETHSGQSESSTASALAPDEMDFLEHVVCAPGKPSSHYPKMARIGTSKAVRIRRHLVGLGYLREEQINVSGRGRSSIVLFPTELGFQTLDASQRAGQ